MVRGLASHFECLKNDVQRYIMEWPGGLPVVLSA